MPQKLSYVGDVNAILQQMRSHRMPKTIGGYMFVEFYLLLNGPNHALVDGVFAERIASAGEKHVSWVDFLTFQEMPSGMFKIPLSILRCVLPYRQNP